MDEKTKRFRIKVLNVSDSEEWTIGIDFEHAYNYFAKDYETYLVIGAFKKIICIGMLYG